MSENLDNWLRSLELNVAYFDFTDQYQRQKFREVAALGPMLAYKTLMCADLFVQLSGGKLKAWGFRLEPTPSDGPVPIPAHCFIERPNVEECDVNIITASGWRYERVRIAIVENGDNFDATENLLPATKSKAGRRSTYPAVKAALASIHSIDPAKIEWSAGQLLDEFNSVYADYAPAMGFPSRTLAARTLHDHLKRFRQELAEIGNNDNAN
ncbi:hypothetical protein Q4610_04795 [Sphingobium sp. HBC34]|uniref:Uncharacterized protein n=1 Tax=Sphingobium cyanobacteriorum TaxID=3063954 RepID=A0ABT8ZLE5_9SPHN|nr:hypothetical protein [Sphingobium sp. HBC34]MDO7834356.1 hypothetical protein [Sphingobium sp. HBC34]